MQLRNLESSTVTTSTRAGKWLQTRKHFAFAETQSTDHKRITAFIYKVSSVDQTAIMSLIIDATAISLESHRILHMCCSNFPLVFITFWHSTSYVDFNGETAWPAHTGVLLPILAFLALSHIQKWLLSRNTCSQPRANQSATDSSAQYRNSSIHQCFINFVGCQCSVIK